MMKKGYEKEVEFESEVEYRKRVGEMIRTIRCQAGISQEALGLLLGISKQTISNVEHGKADLNSYQLYKLCTELNVSLEIFYPKNPKPTSSTEQLRTEITRKIHLLDNFDILSIFNSLLDTFIKLIKENKLK